MTIANINLDVSDENVKKLISEYVSEEIDEKEIDVAKDQRKITVTISKTLNANTIKEAMSKIKMIVRKNSSAAVSTADHLETLVLRR